MGKAPGCVAKQKQYFPKWMMLNDDGEEKKQAEASYWFLLHDKSL